MKHCDLCLDADDVVEVKLQGEYQSATTAGAKGHYGLDVKKDLCGRCRTALVTDDLFTLVEAVSRGLRVRDALEAATVLQTTPPPEKVPLVDPKAGKT